MHYVISQCENAKEGCEAHYTTEIEFYHNTVQQSIWLKGHLIVIADIFNTDPNIIRPFIQLQNMSLR